MHAFEKALHEDESEDRMGVRTLLLEKIPMDTAVVDVDLWATDVGQGGGSSCSGREGSRPPESPNNNSKIIMVVDIDKGF